MMFPFERIDAGARLADLAARGLTVELDCICAGADVWLLTLGWGIEAWTGPGRPPRIEADAVAGGRLIVAGGVPVRDAATLRAHGLVVTDVQISG